MYLDKAKTRINGKIYFRVLLRESYRQKGKVKHRTIANLSKCSEQEIAAIGLALKHKHELAAIEQLSDSEREELLLQGEQMLPPFTLRQGLSVGAVGLLHELAKELGIVEALGSSRQGKLALWQVIARAIDQGSRLSAVRLAGSHAACDLLGLESFNEDHLYENLRWLTAHQTRIENRLFGSLYRQEKPELFLYDVTSSYLEGTKNALGAFGYNRDGKRGKMQIVVGMLCDGLGRPLSVEVFCGNTSDLKTFSSQVKKVAERFGGGEVTFVGDRGMIRNTQIEQVHANGFHYITAITKPQIQALLKEGIFQMELFEQPLAEVEGEGVRYVLRRNAQRAQQVQECRQSKLESLQRSVERANEYLANHARAKAQSAVKDVEKKIGKLKIQAWVKAKAQGRRLELEIDESERQEAARLDGCYVIKTDLSAQQADKDLVHERYKDLALVEQVFRTSKSVELEMRPLYVRCEPSTRGHVLVVMLAYRLTQELARRWSTLDLTVQEGIDELSTLCVQQMVIEGKEQCNLLPQPRESVARLLALAGVTLPEVLRCTGAKVATRKKLQDNRKKPRK
jgi:transposase